jgi:acetoacetate decarboxylase
MAYPPAPWNLYGKALQSLHLVDVERAKPFVPPDFEIVTVLPGKTLGSLYLSVYEANSTLTYHELIVGAASVRYRGQVGTWISHLYVDHPDSMTGGREIWGLPKEMAEFDWGARQINVIQDRKTLCQVRYSSVGLPLSLGGKSSISGTVFGGLAEDILTFEGKFKARLKWISSRAVVPPESPFAALNLGNSWFTLQFQDLHLTANAPSIAGQWTTPIRPSSRPSSVVPL